VASTGQEALVVRVAALAYQASVLEASFQEASAASAALVILVFQAVQVAASSKIVSELPEEHLQVEQFKRKASEASPLLEAEAASCQVAVVTSCLATKLASADLASAVEAFAFATAEPSLPEHSLSPLQQPRPAC